MEELKIEPVDKERRYKSHWLRRVTRMNSNKMPQIMLNYRPNGRRRLKRSLKRLLDEAETTRDGCVINRHQMVSTTDLLRNVSDVKNSIKLLK